MPDGIKQRLEALMNEAADHAKLLDDQRMPLEARIPRRYAESLRAILSTMGDERVMVASRPHVDHGLAHVAALSGPVADGDTAYAVIRLGAAGGGAP